MTGPDDFSSRIISEFRANGGKVGGLFENATLLLLHKAAPRQIPVVILEPANDR